MCYVAAPSRQRQCNGVPLQSRVTRSGSPPALVRQTAEAITTLHLAAEGDDRVGWRKRHALLGYGRGGVGGKKAAPGERGATWRRRDAVPMQDPANGAGRDLEAELAELALEAEIAPATVLVGQLADQLPVLLGDEGRPRRGRRAKVAHFFRTSSRRARAARTRRSAWRQQTNFTWRSRTRTWWRSTSSSA